jgi:hypothetical protein
MAKKVFFSFHFDNDVFRTQQVRNMGVLEGNKPVTAQAWEEAGKTAGGIEKWINDNMKGKSCIVVLVGEKTSERHWVKHEIKKAWQDGLGVVGIHIHNLKCPKNGKSSKGKNPFEQFTVDGTKLSTLVDCHDPSASDAYNDIAQNIEKWIDRAVAKRS